MWVDIACKRKRYTLTTTAFIAWIKNEHDGQDVLVTYRPTRMQDYVAEFTNGLSTQSLLGINESKFTVEFSGFQKLAYGYTKIFRISTYGKTFPLGVRPPSMDTPIIGQCDHNIISCKIYRATKKYPIAVVTDGPRTVVDGTRGRDEIDGVHSGKRSDIVGFEDGKRYAPIYYENDSYTKTGDVISKFYIIFLEQESNDSIGNEAHVSPRLMINDSLHPLGRFPHPLHQRTRSQIVEIGPNMF